MPTMIGRFLFLAATCAIAPLPLRAQAVRGSQADTGRRAAARVTDTDIRFMQGMIGHHAQAVEMAHLVPSRTTNASVRLLAERIDVAQQQEITQMQRWLESHGATAPAVDTGGMHAHHMMGDEPMLMPGMLTAEQMSRLSAAAGAAFDSLFLTFMIQHHEGALVMVAKLFSTQGSGQEPAIFEFASDVDAGQRAEITRMRALLKTPVRRPPK